MNGIVIKILNNCFLCVSIIDIWKEMKKRICYFKCDVLEAMSKSLNPVGLKFATPNMFTDRFQKAKEKMATEIIKYNLRKKPLTNSSINHRNTQPSSTKSS